MRKEDLQMNENSAGTCSGADAVQEHQDEKPLNDGFPNTSPKKLRTQKETYRKLDDSNDKVEDTQKNSTIRISEEPEENEEIKCCQRCWSASLQVYASHFLSSWGDRMWMFAGGLFLLEVTPGSLRLAGVYGAALAFTVIVCGAPVGRWIDRTSRLRAAQLSLSIQNIMVCVCAALLVVITTQRHVFTAWDGWSLVVAEVFVILTACIAQIGTLGSKLAIEKDWILVICGKDKTRLSRMNSVLRSVDLSTEVLAPVIVGAIMTGFGMAAGGIAIATWNVGSLFMEYGLLHYLFYSNADLQKPKIQEENVSKVEENDEEQHSNNEVKSKNVKKKHKLVLRLISAWEAWRAYMNHPVRDAGLGLALLFMTVLAFDNYSRAYVYESGVSETILGILTAMASLFGIFGSLAFPILRTKMGVAKTGLIGFGSETLCLTLCLASVFAPGSPFDASAILRSGESSTGLVNSTRTTPPYFTLNVTTPRSDFVETDIINLNVSQRVNDNIGTAVAEDIDYTSVILLLTGIITSRFGLWVADLTVTQILQEGVVESERGAINGVQSSLNQTLDLLRSILIIILPKRETFGFLIILSYAFVTAAWIMFATFARQYPSSTPTVATTEAEELQPSTV